MQNPKPALVVPSRVLEELIEKTSNFTGGATLPATVSLDAVFVKPGRNMDQQIINEAPYRRQHSARRGINEMKDILRSRPFRQDSLNRPLL